ncbi:uncharacterized protein [Arachis hypogaea]|uniref:uncharacterized protein n=1 Tax=Arachis hypogaea TaxID=3818 RepID=UPI003B2241D4
MSTVGGLALAWKEGTTVEILAEKEFFIAAKVNDHALNYSWGLIGVHLNSLDGIRSTQYTELSSFVQGFFGKVIIMGDFNVIVSLDEKERGEGLKSASSIFEFVNFIDGGGLKDLGMIGRRFTWTNRRRGQDQIRERLDRALQQQNKSNSKKDIGELTSQLEILREEDITGGEQVEALENKFEDAYFKEESYWREKSRNDGTYATTCEKIAQVAETYFKDIFTSINQANSAHAFEDFEIKVLATMNRKLTRPVSFDEVKCAVFSVHPQSAPGDDGFTAKFFQFYWNLVEEDVFKAVRNFFVSGRLLKSFNHTQICLIPKIPNAKNMTQIRPISLFSVVYKIISKVLVHWLQKFMTSLISPNQSIFIKGRLISDNVLVAHECMHYLKTKKRGLSSEMAVKLDLRKAYDRFEWHFLWFILEKLGFKSRWIGWIQEVVTTVSYSVVVEEGLSFLLNKAEQNSLIEGIQINGRCPTSYEGFSGQKVNVHKSALFFSNNTPPAARLLLARKLDIDHIGAQDKYFWSSIYSPKIKKKATFREIKDKVRKRVQGWKRKLLFSAGKHVPDTLIREIHNILSQFWWGQKEIETVPSWGWRSILEGCKVVEKGLVWRVGDGSSIRIFSDPWLAPPHPYVVSSSETSNLQNQPLLMVKNLILSNASSAAKASSSHPIDSTYLPKMPTISKNNQSLCLPLCKIKENLVKMGLSATRRSTEDFDFYVEWNLRMGALCTQPNSSSQRMIMVILSWSLWKARNRFIFDNVSTSVEEIMTSVLKL